MVRYTGKAHDVLRYVCYRGWLDNGEPPCVGFGGLLVDEAVAKEILRVVQPAAVEAAVLAREEQSRQQDEVVEALRRELEAARYSARRAQKQYDLTDPENRLVADELERRWNEALHRVQELEARIDERGHEQSKAVAPARADFENLGNDLENAWNSPNADSRLKKRIVRTLLHEIVADLDQQKREIILAIHWKGGLHTEIQLPHRRRGQNRAQTSKDVVEAISVLARVCSDNMIASVLTRSGLQTGRGNRWTKERVTSLRTYHGISCYSAERRESEGWMNLTEAAQFLGTTSRTLRLAVEQGEIEAEHPLTAGPWIFNRRALQTEASAKLVERVHGRDRSPTIPPAAQSTLDFSMT